MSDYDFTMGTRILGESGDGLFQIIIYVVVGAMMILGNISKARAAKTQKKRTRHTDDPRLKPKPSAQRLQSQISPPRPHLDKTEGSPKYYPPGGFAEALLDEKLEETLKKRSKRAVKSYEADEAPASVSVIKPIQSTEVMEHDLESMGHLETLDYALDSVGSSLEDHWVAADLISIDTPDDLARAIVYAEILSKPVGLRDF